MKYDENIRLVVLDTLDVRVSSISNIIKVLEEEGYNPNKNKHIILNFSSMLIDAYDNIYIFNNIQHKKLDKLYNKIMML